MYAVIAVVVLSPTVSGIGRIGGTVQQNESTISGRTRLCDALKLNSRIVKNLSESGRFDASNRTNAIVQDSSPKATLGDISSLNNTVVAHLSTRARFDVEPKLNETNVTSPYRYGERTRILKKVLLTQDSMKIANRLLIQNGTRWYMKQNDTILGFTAQGGSSTMYQRDNLFGRTEDGQWHKFRNATSAFQQYLSSILLQFDDMKKLACDGREWLGYNRYGECRRFVMQGARTEQLAYAMNEDGQWFIFTNDTRTAGLREYLLSLPKFEKVANQTSTERRRARIRALHDSLVGGVPNRYAPPDCGLREVLASKRVTAPSDDILVDDNGSWKILDRQGDHFLAIEREGIGLEKKEHLIFARSSDGAWHIFHRVPKTFKNFVRGLPKQYDFGKLVYDGQTWHTRNKFGEFENVTEVVCKGRTLKFLSASGKYRNYGIRFSHLLKTMYTAEPSTTTLASKRKRKGKTKKDKKKKKKRKKKKRF